MIMPRIVAISGWNERLEQIRSGQEGAKPEFCTITIENTPKMAISNLLAGLYGVLQIARRPQ
jgi:hypothetical protein